MLNVWELLRTRDLSSIGEKQSSVVLVSRDVAVHSNALKILLPYRTSDGDSVIVSLISQTRSHQAGTKIFAINSFSGHSPP